MILHSERFGDLPCSEENIIRFPAGLPGLTPARCFVVVSDDATSPFRWLVAADDPAVAVTVMDPAVILSDEEPLAGLPEGKTTLVVATPGSGDVAWWLDLRHPILIDHTNRMGEQVTLDDAALPERFPVELRQTEERT